MGIFGDGQRGRVAAKAYNAAANEILQVLCDRCHAAWAKVEVITSAGPVFFCQHHHKKYRHSIIAAGHQIRAMLARYQGRESVTDRVVLVFGGGSWLAGGGAARCARDGTGSDCAGRPPFRVAGTGGLVRRVRAGHTAVASRPGRRPSRASPADLQHAGAGVADQPGGQAEQPVAQRVRLGVFEIVAGHTGRAAGTRQPGRRRGWPPAPSRSSPPRSWTANCACPSTCAVRSRPPPRRAGGAARR